MEDIKRRFANEIAAKLSGAPESDAKSEMIEELAENLVGRYEDMLAAGTPEDEAFQKAMDQLGDVDELTAYLNSLEPDRDPSGDWQAAADSFFQGMSGMARDMADMGRQIAQMAGDFLHSGAVQSAVEEGKRAAREARDFMKSDAVRGAVEEGKKAAREAKDLIKDMADATVHIYVDEDDGAADKADKGSQFGWTDQDSDGERSVPSQDVWCLDVETTGDVDIFVDDSAQAPIRVEGNMSRLEVSVTEDGVLKVRPLFTASIQFFAFRGVSRQDVSLTIPARAWESIRLSTDSGDVDMGDGLEAGSLTVYARSGDIDCRVKSCQQAELKTVSGDIQMEGNAARLTVQTTSGDVLLRGPLGQADVTTTSGDVELSGSVWKAHVKSMSGDIQLESMTLPEAMELASKSGDIEARIPDNGPFKVRASSVSGTVDLRPFAKWSWSGAADPNVPAPQYVLTSISGDVSLDKY